MRRAGRRCTSPAHAQPPLAAGPIAICQHTAFSAPWLARGALPDRHNVNRPGSVPADPASLAEPCRQAASDAMADRLAAVAAVEAHSGDGAAPSDERSTRRHRRSWSMADSLADLSIPLSPVAAAEKLLSEAWRLLGLALQLWSYLGVGARLMPPALHDRGRARPLRRGSCARPHAQPHAAAGAAA